jgi:hypothetical protein
VSVQELRQRGDDALLVRTRNEEGSDRIGSHGFFPNPELPAAVGSRLRSGFGSIGNARSWAGWAHAPGRPSRAFAASFPDRCGSPRRDPAPLLVQKGSDPGRRSRRPSSIARRFKHCAPERAPECWP